MTSIFDDGGLGRGRAPPGMGLAAGINASGRGRDGAGKRGVHEMEKERMELRMEAEKSKVRTAAEQDPGAGNFGERNAGKRGAEGPGPEGRGAGKPKSGKRQGKTPSREDVTRRLAELARGRANDCVRLVLEEGADIGSLDLDLLAELKKSEKGAVEVKLLDRLAVLELLENILRQEGNDPGAFLRALQGDCGQV